MMTILLFCDNTKKNDTIDDSMDIEINTNVCRKS